MRTFLIIALFAPLFAFSMKKNEANLLVEKAQIAYNSGEHEVAAALYDSVLQHFISADVYYNLGNCYFKLNDLPNAILNYERAWKLAPGDEDIYHNLRAADRQVIDEIGSLPMVDLGNSWRRFQAGENMDQWAKLSLLACFIGFLLLAGMVWASKPWLKRSFFFISILVFVLCITSTIFAALRANELEEQTSAVIFAPKVDVRSEPNEDSTRLLILHEGSKVEIEEEQGEWIEIRLPNGTGGWMRAADVVVI